MWFLGDIMNKKFFFLTLLFVLTMLSVVFVYAFVIDSDGGFSPYVHGVCSDNSIPASFTDHCILDSYGYETNILIEYFPNQDMDECLSVPVDCALGCNQTSGEAVCN